MKHHHFALLVFHCFLMEQWRPVPGWEAYEVSNWGRLKSYWRRKGGHCQGGHVLDRTRSRIVKPGIRAATGHHLVTLYDGKGGKHCRSIHSLVLEAFIGPPKPGEEARHVYDPTPSNNFLWNLAWGTKSQNTIDKVLHGNHPLSTLTVDDVREIKRELAKGTFQRVIAERFGLTQSAISLIKSGKNWAHVQLEV